MEKAKDLKTYLQSHFIEKCKKNSKYSLRAYAKFLDLDHSSLSQIMRGKRKITRKLILKVCERLNLDTETLEKFLASQSEDISTKNYSQLTLDTYKIMADWFHFALFELVTVKDFDGRPEAIAQRLDISIDEATAALERLKRVGLLTLDSDKKLVQTNKFITTTGNNFTAPTFRLLQKGIMERSLRALEEMPIEVRDHTSMTMAINSKHLKEAKIRIKNFRRSLCEDLQADSNRDSVYQLAVSFFPLTKIQQR